MQHQSIVVDVTDYAHARGDDGTAPDGNASQDRRAGANPRVVTDSDRAIVVLEGRRATVVAARAQQCPLGDADVVAEANRLEVKQPRVFADPAVVPDL